MKYQQSVCEWIWQYGTVQIFHYSQCIAKSKYALKVIMLAMIDGHGYKFHQYIEDLGMISRVDQKIICYDKYNSHMIHNRDHLRKEKCIR